MTEQQAPPGPPAPPAPPAPYVAQTEAAQWGFEPEFLRKLERLEMLARKVFQGTLRGEHATNRRGRGLEFADFRPYQPGDDLRYVDWNIFSRLDQLFVKLYASEEDLTLHILLDVSASMGFGTPSKFDYARRLAAALAYIGLNSMDRVSLSAFSSVWEGSVTGLKSRQRIRAVLSYLSALRCAGASDFTQAFVERGAPLARRGMVVLISDLLNEHGVENAIRAIRAAGHDLVVIQVLAEEEIEPPLDGAFRLVDAETGQAMRVTVDAQLRAAYQSHFAATLSQLEALTRRLGVEYLRTSTAIAFEDIVLRYLRVGGHWR
ncbi:MAG: hypothetical protein ACI8PT_001375 [Gammaproteobacteria bacterium]